MDNGPLAPSVGEIPGISDLQPIGRGGFATVYRGWQRAFRRAVAVKVFDERPGTPALVRFRKEAEAMGSLSSHPHVVGLYDAGILGGRPYLVMPFLSGGTLQDRLEVKRLPPGEVARVGAAIADALSSAHAIGLLHRDVKPANILYTAYGQPQLADFGIARFADSTLTNGEVAATVTYAAPEVLQGGRATPRSDIYALGATLYAAVTGAPPFTPSPDESIVGFAMRTMREQPADLRRRGVPAELAKAIERAMAKQPARRQASADELRQDLLRAAAALAAGKPPSIRREPVRRAEPTPAAASLAGAASDPTPAYGERPAPRRRARRAWLAAPALLVLAGLAVIGFAVLGPSHPQRPASSPNTLASRSNLTGAKPSTPSTTTATVPLTATKHPSSAPQSTGRKASTGSGRSTHVARPKSTGGTVPSTASTAPPPTTTLPNASTSNAAATTAPATTIAPTTQATVAPTTGALATQPSTTEPLSTTNTGPVTRGAGNHPSASPPPSVSASTLTGYVDDYYSIVNHGDLTASWNWLSPAFQDRLGWAYYQSFWHSIAYVDVVSIAWMDDGADMTLRYQEQSGTTSVERVRITFVTSGGHALIDSYSVQ